MKVSLFLNSFITITRCEFIKILALKEMRIAVFVMSVIVSLSTLSILSLTKGGLDVLSNIGNVENHWAGTVIFFYYLELSIYPIFFAIIISLTFNVENKNNMNSYLNCIPITAFEFFISKLFVSILIIGISFFALSTLNITIIYFISPVNEYFRGGDFKQAISLFYSLNLNLLASSLGYFAIVAIISVRSRNYLLLLSFIIFIHILSFSSFTKYFPFSYPYNSFLSIINHKNLLSTIVSWDYILASVATFIIVIALTGYTLRKM